MNKYPRLVVELRSHTDSRGSATYNMWLSQKRAESAVAYVIAQGIDKSRITARGYGPYRNQSGRHVQLAEDIPAQMETVPLLLRATL